MRRAFHLQEILILPFVKHKSKHLKMSMSNVNMRKSYACVCV